MIKCACLVSSRLSPVSNGQGSPWIDQPARGPGTIGNATPLQAPHGQQEIAERSSGRRLAMCATWEQREEVTKWFLIPHYDNGSLQLLLVSCDVIAAMSMVTSRRPCCSDVMTAILIVTSRRPSWLKVVSEWDLVQDEFVCIVLIAYALAVGSDHPISLPNFRVKLTVLKDGH